MTDFTLNAPGTTNNPWTPAGVIIPVSTIRSNASAPNGWRAGVTGTYVSFADNAAYGNNIISTMTIIQWQSGGDNALVGAVVRSGTNAGGMIGIYLSSTQSAVLCWETPLGVRTNISAGLTMPAAITAGDVYSCTVANSGTTITLSGQQNGTSLTFLGGSTSTQFATESSLAAGAGFDPQDNNTTYMSQFTGTGRTGSSDVFLGQAFM